MKRLILLIIPLLISGISSAQDVKSYGEKEFREFLDGYVSKGNQQYDRSHRDGIKAYADSLETALRLRSEACLLTKDDSKEDSLEYTADLYKLRGDWHYENGNYDSKSYKEAEKYFQQAISVYEKNKSLMGPLNRLPMIHREMAQLMYKLSRYREALSYTEDAYNAFLIAYDNGEFGESDDEYSILLDLKSQKAMCMARIGNTDEALILMDELLKVYPKSSEGYYEVLRKKAKILMLSGKEGCEKTALTLYKQYFTWKKTDALKTLGTMTASEREDYWMRIRPFVADCYQLENADPSFLYDVTLFAKGLLLQLNRISGYGRTSENALNSLKYTWQQIQAKLSKDACAIEFVQYEKLGKQLMGAIVLKKSGTPQWVQMMEPEKFMKYEIGAWTNQERLYTTDGSRKNSMYNDSILQTKLWNEQLCNAIGSSKKIYFAPDGYLHQLAIEYMLPQEIADKNVYRLTSSRRLMEDSKVRTDAALVVGGVRYDAKDVESDGGNDAIAYSYMQNIHANFEYLPGSLTECDTIYSIRDCPKDTLLVGKQATELAFRTLCSKYPILNISTHGYFTSAQVPQSTDIKTAMSDESLSQCVIAMAGANPNISSTDYNTSQMDGLLSAKELSECNLSDVDLIVISACQTGLGYVTSDGVFGIQRGLKNAGAGSLLVSLWNVNDRATCLLMSRFHRNLQNGMSVHNAFMSARESLAEQSEKGSAIKIFNASTLSEEVLEDDESYEEPQFRNAFMLIDAIE